MTDVLFTGATVVTMTDDCPVMRGAYVGVRDGRIIYADTLPPPEEARRTVDASGHILLPGLVNTHAHLGMGCLRGYADDFSLRTWLYEKVFPAEGRMDERAVVAGVRLGMAECIAHGITSVSDMYRFEPQTARLALETGLRVNLCNAVLALDPDRFDFFADGSYRELTELLEHWHGAGNGRIRAEAGIHAEYTSTPREWRQTAELARKHRLGLQVHVSETRYEHEDCRRRRGVTPVEALMEAGVFEGPVCVAHGVWLTEQDGAILASRGACVAHCPVSNLKLASGVAPVRRLLGQGVNVSLGTDSVCSNNILDLFQEMKTAALLQKGVSGDPTALPAWEALKMATVFGAKAQGREGEIGKIEPGYEADLILVDARVPHMRPAEDPVSALVYCAGGSDVRLTMVQGKILYENGSFTTLDMQDICREVETYALPLARGR